MVQKVLSIKKVNKTIGKKLILSDISFSCQEGKIVGLVGANGSGKTTIMKAILGMVHFKGKIFINGENVTFDNHKSLESVGALIEYPSIYPYLTGREQLTLYSKGDDKKMKVEAVIKRLNLSDYIDRKAKKYSLGMKQKLGIAMALLNHPRFVILDEPMNGLDPQATKELRDIILDEKEKGTTFLISSHILSELEKIADDLIIIDKGEVVTTTTMKELKEQNNHYLILKTSDDIKACELLQEIDYELVERSPIKLRLSSKNHNSGRIISHLTQNQIEISDIKHQDDDLEASVLKIINRK